VPYTTLFRSGHAVDGGRGGEDHIADPGARAGGQHVGQSPHVVVPVHLGLDDGFADLLVGGEVDHGVGAGGTQVGGELLARVRERDVDLHQLGTCGALLLAGDQA